VYRGYGLAVNLHIELKIPVYRVDDPLTRVARGAGRVAEALHLSARAIAARPVWRSSG
jgi:rod shape-determining protein MreB and related proteins